LKHDFKRHTAHNELTFGEQQSAGTGNVVSLNLKGKGFKDIGFVHKAVGNFMSCLENLDFADNDLGNSGCK
jgi:hypothetical protein